MATGAPGTNGVWQYGEDDSEATFSALLNKAASTTDTQLGLIKAALGKILQVKSMTYSTFKTTSSSTFSDTGLSLAITPKATTSKILVIATHATVNKAGTAGVSFQLLRDASVLTLMSSYAGYTGSTAANYVGNVTAAYLDSPSTTSAITYKTQYCSSTNAGAANIQDNGGVSTLILLEVGA